MVNARLECEFFLLRYVPDPVRNEFVHIGVILREAARVAGSMPGPMAMKFTADWRRVRCLDPDADTGMLEDLEMELRRRFAEEPEGNLFHVLEDSFSNCVQMSRGKAYLAESLEVGLAELMRLFVEPQKRERVLRLSGRAAIQGAMRGEFERAGVWDLMRKRIAAAEYTRAGDPLRIDCGYRGEDGGREQPGAIIRMFQAVSLEPGLEMAKVLAFSAPSLFAGVERVEKAQVELTAVIEPWWDRQGKSKGTGLGRPEVEEAESDADRVGLYRFAVETMEESRIRVLTTADLGRVAETARREMRV